MELVEWLAARLDADGRVARAALDPDDPAPWASLGTLVAGTSGLDRGSGERLRVLRAHIALNDPAHVLRVVAAHRAILALHEITTEQERWDSAAVDGSHLSGDLTGRTVRWCAVCDVDPRTGKRYAGTDPACPTLLCVASIYSDRPGYAEEWKP